ncbi:MAG TPA: hypothetical protein VKT81_06775 [Bryobacteraceae bacterium]|nr:hypothetical protein [Bryobacteraceae bacterium]
MADDNDNSPLKGPGYQPSTGRKIFMFFLCLAALIAVWIFYWLAPK